MTCEGKSQVEKLCANWQIIWLAKVVLQTLPALELFKRPGKYVYFFMCISPCEFLYWGAALLLWTCSAENRGYVYFFIFILENSVVVYLCIRYYGEWHPSIEGYISQPSQIPKCPNSAFWHFILFLNIPSKMGISYVRQEFLSMRDRSSNIYLL